MDEEDFEHFHIICEIMHFTIRHNIAESSRLKVLLALF